MIDVDDQISAVRRTVSATTVEAGPARVVALGQSFDTGADDLWDACTSPERIARWFLPVTGDLRVGGRYQLEGNAGGQVLSCEPPTSFSATWEFGGEVTWIMVRVVSDGPDRSRFELEHVARVDDERWALYGPGAVGVGWDMGLMGLSLHLSRRPPVEPAEVAAWAGSDEGRAFVTRSSERWHDASVAAGTDPAAARGAADRTTAAYLAAPA